MNISLRSVALWILFLVVPLGFIFAQEEEIIPEDVEIEEGLLEDIAAPANTVSCFDYYTFGSVQADLTAPVTSAVSGTAITFSGKLVNKNPYPVVDGALYVKIFKSRGPNNDGNGPDVVDQFLVKGDIVIPANGSIPVSFPWKIPSYAVSGEYSVAAFFTTSRKFNLLGLSFTDDVVGNTVPFRVSGEQRGRVGFDKAGVKIAGESYYFAAFPPRVEKDAPAEVRAKVVNTTGKEEKAGIRWTIYQWDAQLRENVVHEENASVTVPANGSKEVVITVQDSQYPVYLVVGELRWNDTKSVIGARFVREGVDRTRINFPGVMQFPLVAGEANTLFSCLHNSGESAVVSGGSLDLTLSDRDGNVIHEYRYDGDITGAMMGVISEFTPKKTYDYFNLSARLYQGEEFVDEANLVYDCEQINPSLCSYEEPSVSGALGSVQSLAVIALGVIVLLIALAVYRRVVRRTNTTQLPPM